MPILGASYENREGTESQSRIKQQSSYKHVLGHADKVERTLRTLTARNGHMGLGRDLKAERS